MTVQRNQATTRNQASRTSSGGLPPLPVPAAWSGALGFSASAGAVNTFWNAHMLSGDYTFAQGIVANTTLSTITRGKKFISVGPQNTAAAFTQALADCVTNGCTYFTWGDEFSQNATTLLNGAVFNVGSAHTTLAADIGASDTTLTYASGTLFNGQAGATPNNSFPKTAGYTIKIDNEQIVINNANGQALPTVNGLLRGANNPPGGVGGGPQAQYNATTHTAGTTVTLITNDIGLNKAVSLAHNYSPSLRVLYIPLGATWNSLVAAGPPYTNLIALSNVADANLYQAQRDSDLNNGIAAFATAASSTYNILRAQSGNRPTVIQVQTYSPFTNKNYTESQLKSAIDQTAALCTVAPDWFNIWYNSAGITDPLETTILAYRA